jgi:hypothetical protein
MCIRVCSQTGGQSTFSGNAGQQDAHCVGQGKPHTGQRIGGLCFQVIIHADVKH